jgi:hypothetical protein
VRDAQAWHCGMEEDGSAPPTRGSFSRGAPGNGKCKQLADCPIVHCTGQVRQGHRQEDMESCFFPLQNGYRYTMLQRVKDSCYACGVSGDAHCATAELSPDRLKRRLGRD